MYLLPVGKMAAVSMLTSCVRSLFYRRDFRSYLIGHHIRSSFHTTYYVQTDSPVHRIAGKVGLLNKKSLVFISFLIGRVAEKKHDNKMILHQNLDSVARKLKMPSLKPIYLSTPEQRGSQISWKTILTLKWPEKSW